jgi:phosphoribosylcarboxyaminoimidazole (NCAIR) mutase
MAMIAADTSGQLAGVPAEPAPIPGAGGLLSPMWMPLSGIHIEFFST